MNWRNLIFNNLPWKLLSLFIAMIIWSTYHSGEEGTIDIGGNLFEDKVSRELIGYHVQLLSQQNGSRTVELEPEDVTISLRGTAEIMAPITSRDVLAYVDVSNLAPGTTNKIPIAVRAPNGVKVVSVYPTNTTVRVIEKILEPAPN